MAACLGAIGLCVWLLMATGGSPANVAEPEAPPASPAPPTEALPVPAAISQPPVSPPSPAPANVGETGVAAPQPAAPSAPPPAAAPAAKPPSVLGQLELQVNDGQSRQPMNDGRVFVALTAEVGTSDARTWRGLSSFKSAAIEAGKVEIAGLAAGEYSYMLTGRGVLPKTGRVFVGAGKTTQLVTVERRQVPQSGQPGGARGAGRGRGNRGGTNPGGVPGQPNAQGANPGGTNPESEEAPRPARRRR